MTLKISSEHKAENTVVRVEGRLEGEGVAELDRVCRGAARPLHLELGSLLSLDEVGVGLLRSLVASGATVTGASPYIRLLLEHAALASPWEKPDRN
ncbi:MAG: hypothetical protein ACRD1B_10305 [Thermoanaerobaculia bacterium]